MRIENWQGHDIRFVEVGGEWYAILKDICDALDLRTDGVVQRLDSDMMTRVKVEVSNHPSKVDRYKDGSNDVEYEHQPGKVVNNAIGPSEVPISTLNSS